MIPPLKYPPLEGFSKPIQGPLIASIAKRNGDIAVWRPTPRSWEVGATGWGRIAYCLRLGSEIHKANAEMFATEKKTTGEYRMIQDGMVLTGSFASYQDAETSAQELCVSYPSNGIQVARVLFTVSTGQPVTTWVGGEEQ